MYRIIDFKLEKMDIPAVIETIEYDPYRSAFICLVCYRDGERRYILAHKEASVGQEILISADAKPVAGNRLEIGNIPTGFAVHNVELIVGHGAKIIRSAGSSALVTSQEGEYTQLKMPSGEIRRVHKKCFATIGQVSNEDWNQIVIGKA